MLEILHETQSGDCDNTKSLLGVRGRVVRVIDLELLASYRCVFESRHVPWIFSCGEAMQLVYGMSVALLRYSVGHEIMLRSSYTSKVGKSPYNL